MDEIQKIVRDAGDRYIVDIQLIPFNEEEQKVERTFELFQFYLVRCIIHVLSICHFPQGRANVLICGQNKLRITLETVRCGKEVRVLR